MRLVQAFAASLLLCSVAIAQQPAPPAVAQVHHEANFDAERAQANQLYLAQKRIEALPLYEDLSRQDPTLAVFAERYGAGLLAKAESIDDAKQKQDLMMQGMKELQRAESLGDTSPFVEGLLETMAHSPIGMAVGGPLGALPLTVGYTYNGSAKAQPLLNQAQTAFAHADYAAAVKLYLAAAAADPAWYMAALYTGDAYFQLKDIPNAGVWFAKAIAIDPDRETAYRYWGDALMRAGDAAGAKGKFEQAIAAEPFGKSSFVGLQQWGIQTHTSLTPPRIGRPQFTMKDGQFTETPLTADNGTGDTSWLVYRKARLAHGKDVVLNQWVMAGASTASPDFHFVPTGYVHTLGEEVEAIQALLLDLHARIASGELTEARLDPSLRTMLQVDKDGMLEPFILLNFNDAAIRHGYAAYRAAHRDNVIAYIDRFYIGPPLPANAPNPYVQVHP